MINVRNDKKQGYELIEIGRQKMSELLIKEKIDGNAYQSEPTAWTLISNKKIDMGDILELNILFALLFGY